MSQAVKNISTDTTSQFFSNLLLQILTESDSAIPSGATGRFNFHFSGVRLLIKLKKNKNRVIRIGDIVNFHPEKIQKKVEKNISAISSNEHTKANHVEALESEKSALDIRLKVVGKNIYKPRTATIH